jgi:hypothetical protein
MRTECGVFLSIMNYHVGNEAACLGIPWPQSGRMQYEENKNTTFGSPPTCCYVPLPTYVHKGK